MKSQLIWIVMWSFLNTLNAQTLTGKVVNAQTGEPIPYVNIGVIGSTYGTVSGLNGEYEFLLSENQIMGDSIRFSCVGFKSMTWATTTAIQQSPLKIALQALEIELPEITIKPLHYETLGNDHITTKNATNLAIKGQPNQNLGSAIGRKFRVKKSVQLDKFRFYVAYNNFDTVHFRINVYRLADGRPAEIINQENIIIPLVQHKKGWVNVDLSPYHIKVEDNFAVAAEWVYASKKGTALGLPITIPSVGAVHFYKYGSQNHWKRFPQMSSCMEVTVAW